VMKKAAKGIDELVFVTANEHKLAEARAILSPLAVRAVVLDLPEMQGSPEEIAREKALSAFSRLKTPLFVEDTSLHCAGLKGLPGPYIKHFIAALGPAGIFRMASAFGDTRATARTTLAYCLADGEVLTVQGEASGTLVEPRGASGFGFDPSFLPDGEKKTFGEMSAHEKNKISHRRRALEALRKVLLER